MKIAYSLDEDMFLEAKMKVDSFENYRSGEFFHQLECRVVISLQEETFQSGKHHRTLHVTFAQNTHLDSVSEADLDKDDLSDYKTKK